VLRDATLADGFHVSVTFGLTLDVAAAPPSFASQIGADVAAAAGAAVTLVSSSLVMGDGRRLVAGVPTAVTVTVARASTAVPAAADQIVYNAIAALLAQLQTPFSELRQSSAGRYLDPAVPATVAVVAADGVGANAPSSGGAAASPGAIVGFVILAFAVLIAAAVLAIVLAKRRNRHPARKVQRRSSSRSGVLSGTVSKPVDDETSVVSPAMVARSSLRSMGGTATATASGYDTDPVMHASPAAKASFGRVHVVA